MVTVNIDEDTLELLKKVHAVMDVRTPDNCVLITYDTVIYNLAHSFLAGLK